MVSKRKLAPGDQRDERHSTHAPVDVSEMQLPAAAPHAASSLGLNDAAAALAAARTSFEQLSALQRLKARIAESPATEGGDELGAVLGFLFALYLLPASRPLRKTLVAVVAAAEAKAEAKAEAINSATSDGGGGRGGGGGGGGGGENLAVAAANAAVGRYYAAVFGSGSGWQPPASLAGASAEVATFLACLEVPLLVTPLLEGSSSRGVDRVAECLAVFASILAVHQAPLALAAGSSE